MIYNGCGYGVFDLGACFCYFLPCRKQRQLIWLGVSWLEVSGCGAHRVSREAHGTEGGCGDSGDLRVILASLHESGCMITNTFPLSGLNIQGEPSCASKNLSVAHGNKEKEGDCSQTSGSMSPGISSKTILETDKSTLKVRATILRH